ncbi:MAG: thioredoxin family protein [Chitinophagales bacterium]|nr:thioredoxin family protein [Chitinophagales bacterium]
MKKLFFLPLVFFVLTSQAQTISFIDNDWARARTEASSKNKYIFVDAYTDWCYWCKVMDKQTFPDKEVVKFMSENFVPLKLEMEHNYGINVAMKYRVRSFPTFLVFSSDGHLVSKISGYMEPATFLGKLKEALDPARKNDYAGVSVDVDLAFPDFYKSVFGGKKNRPEAAVVNTYLDEQKDFFSEINYNVLVTFAGLLSEKHRSQLLDNRNKYEELYGKGDIDAAVYSVSDKLLRDAIKSKAPEDLTTALNFSEKYQTEDKEDNKNYLLLKYYEGVQNWPLYGREVEAYIAKHPGEGNQINGFSWTVYEKCDDAAIINKAVGWMKPVVQRKQEYASTDTYAALLYKAQNFKEAKVYAKKAIELGKAAGEKTDETEKLLKKIEAAK